MSNANATKENTMNFRKMVREIEAIAIGNANGCKKTALRMISLSQSLSIAREVELSALCLAKKRLSGV